MDSPAVEEAGRKLSAACKARGIAFMVVPANNSVEAIQASVDAGGSALCFNVDQNILLNAYRAVKANCANIRLN